MKKHIFQDQIQTYLNSFFSFSIRKLTIRMPYECMTENAHSRMQCKFIYYICMYSIEKYLKKKCGYYTCKTKFNLRMLYK